MTKYFGTDGIRGKFGDPHMCPVFAFRLAVALAQYLKQTRQSEYLCVVIGRDTRISGVSIAEAMVAGFNRHSIGVLDGGVIPTPAVAGSVIEKKADLGIAVTASHNPAHDNGIKLFDSNGRKFDESEECVIEQLLDEVPSPMIAWPSAKSDPLDASAFYINYVRSLMEPNCLAGWKIVLDTANGATFQTSPAVIRWWGAEIHIIGDEPDGSNINADVGSEYPEQLALAVIKQNADIGIAHDGDGDRLVVCDETGTLIDGDILLALLGAHAMQSGLLKANTLVATIHSNLGLDRVVSEAGGSVERVDVGDRNVAKAMRELGSNLGGESSGHIIFSDFATTGDGLLAAVKVIELMLQTGKRLSALRGEVTMFPQATKNLKVAEKLPVSELEELNRVKKQLEDNFGTDGRVLIRYSGTEPKLRMLVEGVDPLLVEQAIARLEVAARADLSIIGS